MRAFKFAGGGIALLLLGAAAPVDTTHLALPAETQRYLIAMPDRPVADVVRSVLGETLGLPIEVDPAVTGVMSFTVDGVYAPPRLVEELARQLLGADAVLVQSPDGRLTVLPRSALAAAQARGDVAIGLPGPEASTVSRSGGDEQERAVVDPVAAATAASVLAVAGAALYAIRRRRRRRSSDAWMPPILIEPGARPPEGDGLIIPDFSGGADQRPGSRSPSTGPTPEDLKRP